ncbi:rhodanese-like domain-containing protein [Zunongwangia sp.]|uniref:rhodanese-like domain-containing protein n=1 Tax=Zunongwangia sp. TaxID=1965325 RepID=UPI003AA9A4F4
MKNSFYILLLILASFQSCKKLEASEIQMISAEEMQQRFQTENIQVIDVRSAEEFSKGHILTAKNILVNEKADNPKFFDTLNKEQPIVVYGRESRQAKKAINILEDKGFKEVYELEGGIENWILLGGNLD